MIAAGNTRERYNVKDYKSEERKENIISDNTMELLQNTNTINKKEKI